MDGLDTNLLSLGRVQENGGSFCSVSKNVMIIEVGDTTFETVINASDGLCHIANVRNDEVAYTPAVALLGRVDEYTY